MFTQTTDRSEVLRKAGPALLIANMLGAVVFLVLVSASWRRPEDAEIPVTGEPVVWFGALLPVAVVFVPLNLAWGALIVWFRKWQAGRQWLFMAALWVIALVIDNSQH